MKAYIKIAKLRTEIKINKQKIKGLRKEAIKELRKEGITYDKIVAILNISKGTAIKLARWDK